MNVDLTIKKYKSFIRTGNIICTIISILIILLPGNILSIPFGFLFYLAATKIIATLAVNNIILPVIKQNADPLAFTQILNELKIFTANATERIIASYLSGDYQNTINICTAKLKDVSQQRYAHIYYTYIARCYFDLGDNDKLKETCEQFKQMANTNKKGKEIIQRCTAMRFFELFLDEDYDSCRQTYENILKSRVFGNDILSEIQTKFTYAVACYHTGDLQTASETFEFIANRAPKLNYAKLSREYLECIKNETPLVKPECGINTDSDFTIPRYSSKRQTVGKTIIYAGLFLSLVAVLIFTITQTDMSFKLF